MSKGRGKRERAAVWLEHGAGMLRLLAWMEAWMAMLVTEVGMTGDGGQGTSGGRESAVDKDREWFCK